MEDRLQTIFLWFNSRVLRMRDRLVEKTELPPETRRFADDQVYECEWRVGTVVEKKEDSISRKRKARQMTVACKQIYRIGVPMSCAKITIEEAEARIALRWLHRGLSPSHTRWR
jgi:hypothetical protein